MRHKKSLYDKTGELGLSRKNEGFNYSFEDFLLKKTLSPALFRNSDMEGFLSFINDIFVNNIDSVKDIRIHNNFTINKNTKYID